jgi:hypothetical protein
LGSTNSKNIALVTAQSAFRVREIDHEVWLVVLNLDAVEAVAKIAVGAVAALFTETSDKTSKEATAVCDALQHQDKTCDSHFRNALALAHSKLTAFDLTGFALSICLVLTHLTTVKT